ncbi:hypothetical protein V498_06476 [Pseudogymnoascus sp. VKM F-4517 (FW-2822)]|nr:hypothetical protein V498_06476 [Pseudogymnoascus sp. VKM F-4517 (FW-2822)]
METVAAPLPSLVFHDEVNRGSIDPRSITETWLQNLQQKVSENQLRDVSELFIDECWWRDIVALSWNITTKCGRNEISQYLQLQAAKSGFGQLNVVDQGALQPRLSNMGGLIWIESGFSFETKVGTGRGIVRLANVGPLQWKAWIVHTNLDELKGFPEQSPQEKPKCYKPTNSQVLIIGAGQSGLALAARLKALGVSALIVDKSPQVGDSWRQRYESVKSHTPRYTDHFPHLDYPSDYPDFLPRNHIIGWMEHYQKVMDLNIEFGVTVGKVDYDNSTQQYTIAIKSQDGSERVVTSRHLVLATGLIGRDPLHPEFENESSFTGQIYHSLSHKSASLVPDLGAKRVAIIGAGTSAFDIAQDFVNCGAKEVTIIQRSPVFVLSLEAQDKFVFAGWNMMPTNDADLAGNSFPLPVALTLHVGVTQMMAQHDARLLSGLEKAGLSVKRGEDGTGLLHHQLLKAGHFYVDQGACQMIVDGKIKIKRSKEGVKGFDQKAVVLADGEALEADIVVVATGFKPSSDVAKRIMGEEFMAKVGKMGELDEEKERIAWWRPTAVPGFWYMTGSFLWSRCFSKPLALQIKAVEEGLNPDYNLVTYTVEYSEEAGLYDSVMTYDADDDHDIGVEVGADDMDSKIAVVNFSARGGAADRWAEGLKKSNMSVTLPGKLEAKMAKSSVEMACGIDSNRKVYRRSTLSLISERFIPYTQAVNFKNGSIIAAYTYSKTNIFTSLSNTMSASDIILNTAIAAVNNNDHLRIYTQDTNGGVRESLYEGKWQNGNSSNTIIRVYTLSTDNVLTETAYSANRGWYTGDLGAKKFVVAPYSKIAATFLATGSLQLRVYAQLPDNTIQEYGYDSASSGWEKQTNLGSAVAGSSIATTSFNISSLSIRTYIQTPSLSLAEHAYDSSKGWYTGAFSISSAPPRAAIAATSFSLASTIALRVYHAAADNTLIERAYDGDGWYAGAFVQRSIPGTQAAVIAWTSEGTQLRVYFQNGTQVTGVSEWVWSNGWVKGAAAIPPAAQ